MSGGGLGTGAGGILGSLAGAALAPETGGLSLLLPAVGGAAGAELGNVFTGNTQNPLMAALMGGIGGGLSGAAGVGSDLGISNSAGIFDSGAAGAGADMAGAGATADALGASAGQNIATPAENAALSSSVDSGVTGLANTPIPASAAASGAGGDASMLGNVGHWASKNPLQAALLGETALSGVQSLLPHPNVNIGQTADQVKATDPNWNAKLPQYKLQNTASPYQGNWYTYGQQPEAAMYNAQPQLQARGGIIKRYAEGGSVGGDESYTMAIANSRLDSVAAQARNALDSGADESHPAVQAFISTFGDPAAEEVRNKIANRVGTNKYSIGGTVSPGNRVNPLAGVMPRLSNALRSNAPPMHGSRLPMVHGYAMGGPVMPGAMPQQAPSQGMPPQAPSQQKINPLQLASAHKIGVAIGQHLKAHGYDPHKTPDGIVKGQGGGQDDAVPAHLSQDEFVVPADVVAHLGDGSSNEGGKKLEGMLHKVRAHKVSRGANFPPKSKNPLAYIGGAK